MLIEVTNDSDLTLPYLSFDLTLPRHDLVGGISLPVSTVLPGQTETIAAFAYTRLSHVDDAEISLEPDPWPEDREFYWEFGRPEE